MFLGEVVKQRRLQQKLTQSALAEGICNQNVISKLEQKNHAPKMATLIPILNRLKLTLNDVYSEYANNIDTEVRIELEALQQEKMLHPEIDITDRLDIINPEQVSYLDKIIYYYNQGLESLAKSDREGALFEMDRVLSLTKNDSYSAYTILAYLVKALVYRQDRHSEREGYFVSLVQQATSENLNLTGATSLQLLYICKLLVQYYHQQEDWSQAIVYADRGLQLSKQTQVASFTEVFYWIKALNAEDSPDKFNYYRQMAIVMTKHNDNQNLLAEIENYPK